MAESRQYITQLNENGRVMISEDVISTLVIHAVADVEGCAGLSTKPGADIADMIGKKNWGKGLKVSIGENNALNVECNILVQYGQSVVTVAQAVQDAVCATIESTTGIRLTAINVNVCGIVRQ